MDKDVFYCKSWFRAKKKPIELWDEKKALKKHKVGEPYTVLIGSDTNPSCFINVTQNAGWVSVSFLDKELREYLLYSFKVLNNIDIFLSTAVYREFAENEGEGAGILNVSRGTTYIFNEDGNTVVLEEQFNPHLLEESQTKTDVSGNYDRFPEFGCYDSLIKVER
ncbi:lytic transglycosylase [Klebsiella sp. Ap-873]|nr:lytic transglycosylase [Klebsiella sp. Ap-873]